MKIYDCFLFYNEFDLLEIRLNELNEVVDKFVICASKFTFSRNINEYFDDIRTSNIYKKFQNKIDLIEFIDIPENIPMNNEIKQRNFIGEYLKTILKEDDVVLLSDLDEIPNNKIDFNISDNIIYTLEQKMYFYYLNNLCVNVPWGGTKMFTGKTFLKNNLTTENIRRGFSDLDKKSIDNNGWHFSYIGNDVQIMEKIKNFSHNDYIDKFNIDKNKIAKFIETNNWLFGDDVKIQYVKMDETFPKYVLNNLKRFSHIIKDF